MPFCLREILMENLSFKFSNLILRHINLQQVSQFQEIEQYAIVLSQLLLLLKPHVFDHSVKGKHTLQTNL